jgi:hypothetical protein
MSKQNQEKPPSSYKVERDGSISVAGVLIARPSIKELENK